MSRFLLPALSLGFLLSIAGVSAGNTYSSLGGFGNVVYPGTGHAPNAAFLAGRGNGGGAYGGGYRGGPVNHGNHSRSVIVPYPLFYGTYPTYGYGAGYGYTDAPQADPNASAPLMNPNGVPSVVINQNFAPDGASPLVREYGPAPQPAPGQDLGSGMRLYQTPPTHPYADYPNAAGTPARGAAYGHGDEPTVYLIAFRDHSIVQALGYWMEANTLHYVSAEHSLNQVSLDLVDRSLSQRLNDERGIEFKLPATH